MRRALILLAAADAAAKFALEKKGQKVLNVKLYETGYTFTNRGDKEKKPQTLREISGCSFGKKRDNGRREITLVEDKGYLITSSVLIKGDLFRNPRFRSFRSGFSSPDRTRRQAPIAPRYPCQEMPTTFSGSSTTRGAEAKDVEAAVRQPRRGGRAAHREAAEPVL